MTWLFGLLGKLPLAANHAVGAALGWLAWWTSSRHRRITRENIESYCKHTGADDLSALLRSSIPEQGKGISELAIAWTAPVEKLYAKIRSCTGWEHVDAAKAQQRAIIFVTPHLGCYDIGGRYLTSRITLTALYRPPKQRWLEPLMQQGRARDGAATAAADTGGVRALMKALKSGGNILILPDQVPAPEQGGDGVWVDFLGRPAYTMTLLPRLAQSANAVVLFFFAERLPRGGGYHVHIVPMQETFSTDKQVAARQTNTMVEKLIKMAPAQYLWGYNRYKQPAGAVPPAPILIRQLIDAFRSHIVVVPALAAPKWVAAMGHGLGTLLFHWGRKRVTLINLKLCFPDLTEAERERIGRGVFQNLGRSTLELGRLWYAPVDVALENVKLIDRQFMDEWRAKAPVIVLAPHFVGLDIGGARFSREYAEAFSMYSEQKNKVFDRALRRARKRYSDATLITRQQGLRPVLKALKDKKPFYYLPDMDFGAKDAVFADFFGVKTATVTALSRLAEITGAKVIPLVTRQTADGYEVRFYPAWENFPSGDAVADARRMNAFLEERILEMPDQYFWVHKRFKTRPPGETYFY